MSKVQSITYYGNTVEVELSQKLAISFDRLTLGPTDYLNRLDERPDVCKQLRTLIIGLFECRVIELCSISLRTKMQMELPSQSPTGRIVLVDERLERFVEVFEELTKLKVEQKWLGSSVESGWVSEGPVSKRLSSLGRFLERVLARSNDW